MECLFDMQHFFAIMVNLILILSAGSSQNPGRLPRPIRTAPSFTDIVAKPITSFAIGLAHKKLCVACNRNFKRLAVFWGEQPVLQLFLRSGTGNLSKAGPRGHFLPESTGTHSLKHRACTTRGVCYSISLNRYLHCAVRPSRIIVGHVNAW
jgi:hypothetical protein